MVRSSSKRKNQPSPTSSKDDSDYEPDYEQEFEGGDDEEIEEQAENEEEYEEDNHEDDEENEEEVEEDGDELAYDSHRFINKDAQDQFDSYWSKRAILCERGINLNHFSEEPADFKTIMTTRGWTTAMAFRATADPNLIREFYANALLQENARSGQVSIISRVRGQQITVHRRSIRVALEIPKVRMPGYPYPSDQEPSLPVLARHLSEGETRSWGVRRQFPKNKLSGNFRILHELICSQILPVSNDDFVNPDRARLMYAITTGTSIDLASLMMNAMKVRLQQTRAPNSLPFAGLVMKILEKKHVPIDVNFRIVRPLAMLSQSTSARSLAQYQNRSTSEATTSTLRPARPPVVPTIRSDIHALGVRLSAIEAEQHVQRGLLESILAAVRPPSPPPAPASSSPPPAQEMLHYHRRRTRTPQP